MTANTNYGNFTFAAEALNTVDTALTTLEANTDFLPSVDQPVLNTMVRIGQKTETFTEEAINLGKEYPDLLPKGLSLTQAEAALANRKLLKIRYNRVRKILERIDVAMSLCGTDAYNAGLMSYRSLKTNGRDATLRAQVRELGYTFRSARKEEAETPATPGGAGSTGSGASAGSGNTTTPTGGGQA